MGFIQNAQILLRWQLEKLSLNSLGNQILPHIGVGGGQRTRGSGWLAPPSARADKVTPLSYVRTLGRKHDSQSRQQAKGDLCNIPGDGSSTVSSEMSWQMQQYKRHKGSRTWTIHQHNHVHGHRISEICMSYVEQCLLAESPS